MEQSTAKPIAPLKTAAEVLDSLGLAHTEDHLRIAQAGIDENKELRASLRGRIREVKSHFEGFQDSVKRLGVPDVAGLFVRFIMQARELNRVRPLRDETEFALREAVQLIPPGPDKRTFMHLHEKAVKRAKTLRPPASVKRPSGPTL
jgi:hypothetical protein